MTFNIDMSLFSASTTMIFKLGISAILGMLVGRERKKYKKPGGARTFAIVAMGACLISLLTTRIASIHTTDFARLLSYGIASMGFLGAGVITKDKNSVVGITTASTLWAMVPIGYCIGLGYYDLAITATVVLYLLLESKKIINRKRKKL